MNGDVMRPDFALLLQLVLESFQTVAGKIYIRTRFLFAWPVLFKF